MDFTGAVSFSVKGEHTADSTLREMKSDSLRMAMEDPEKYKVGCSIPYASVQLPGCINSSVHSSHLFSINWPVAYLGGYVKNNILSQVREEGRVPLDFEHVNMEHGRICIRPTGSGISNEPFHRDHFNTRTWSSINKDNGYDGIRLPGNIYNGVYNAGPGNMIFEYVPYSHNHLDPYTGQAHRPVLLMPGQALLYDHRVLHRFAPGKVRNGYTLMHFGIRCANDPDSFWADTRSRISEGYPPRRFDGSDVDPLSTGAFRSVHKDYIIEWAKNWASDLM